MTGVVCLQGGAEFQPGCESMDAAVLVEAGPPEAGPPEAGRRIVVAPFAGRPGRERELAGAHADRWYRGLGVADVTVVLDEAGDELERALDGADLLVLPGGSPARLLAALRPHSALLQQIRQRGTAISGASAGAMVLCRWTVLPEARPHVVQGLGIVEVDLVLPHYRGSTVWLDGARHVLPQDAMVLGLPERSGALVRSDGSWQGLGVEPVVALPAL